MLSAVIHASMILLGILLIVAYSQMQQNMPGVSLTSDVGRALEGLYTMGVMFLSVGLTLAIVGDEQISATYVTYFLILLGVVLTTLAGILVAKTSGTAKSWAIAVMVVGLLFIVGASALLFGERAGHVSLSYCSL